MFGSYFFYAYLCTNHLAMALRKVNQGLLNNIEIERKAAIAYGNILSTTHTMSKENYLSIYEHLFKHNSVQVTYNNVITDVNEQVTVTIGI